jgi:hypothetical protein
MLRRSSGLTPGTSCGALADALEAVGAGGGADEGAGPAGCAMEMEASLALGGFLIVLLSQGGKLVEGHIYRCGTRDVHVTGIEVRL